MSKWTVYLNCDYEPHSAHVNGHVGERQATNEDRKAIINAFVTDMGLEEEDVVSFIPKRFKLKHLWLYDAHAAGDEDADEEFPYQFCQADQPGAFPVTGVYLQ